MSAAPSHKPQGEYAHCPWCGGFDLGLAYYFADTREFELEYCCDISAYEWQYEIEHVGIPRKAWRHFFKNLGINVRQVTRGRDGELYLDWGLEIHDVSRKTAQAFVERHHRHCKAAAGDRLRLSAMNGPDMVAVCVAGRPVARHIDQFSVLEITRLCVRHDLEIPGLVWNACSQLYAEAARRAEGIAGVTRVINHLGLPDGEGRRAPRRKTFRLQRPASAVARQVVGQALTSRRQVRPGVVTYGMDDHTGRETPRRHRRAHDQLRG